MPPAESNYRMAKVEGLLGGAIVGSAAQITSRVLSLLLGLALMAFLTRRLGVADYGLYAVAVVVMNWLSITIAVATVSATVRLVAGQEQSHRYAATMLQLVTLLGLGLSLAMFLAAEWVAAALRAPGIAPLLRILSPDLALAAMAAIYAGILVGRERFFASAGVVVFGAAIQLAVAWVLVEGGWRTAGGCAAQVAGSAAQVVAGRWLTGVALWQRDRVAFAHLWGHVRLLALGQLALRVSQSMDLLAVKAILRSPVAAGNYAGAQNISFAAMGLFAPATGVVLQSLAASRRAGRLEESRRTAANFLRTALIYAGLLCGLSAAAPRITAFLLGPEFTASAHVLALLLWAVAFRVLSITGRVLISAVNERTSILLPLLALIALGIAAYAVAIPRAGITGAAWVALGLALAAGITSLREGILLIGISFPWWSAARVTAGAAAAGTVAGLVPGSGPWLLPVLAAASLAHVLMLALLGEWGHPRDWLALRRVKERL